MDAAPMDLPQANKAELLVRQDVLSALASLGYAHGDIPNKVQALQEEGMTTDQLLRRVLQSLS